MSTSVQNLIVRGLHGRHDVDLRFGDDISIFMGPNGIGKSTILNIFVYFLSRQWQRLSKQPFISASVFFASGEEVQVTRSECQDLSSGELPARIQQVALALAEQNYLDHIIEGHSLDDDEIATIEANTGFTSRDIRLFRNNLFQYGQATRSLSTLASAGKRIVANFRNKIVYLPTYRRIEQDITEILAMSPMTLRRVQTEIAESVSQPQSNYTELVRFGMEDISNLLRDYTSEIKEYSRQQVNSLSTRYLTAALRPRQNFDRAFYNSLADTRIRDVLARVDDQELDSSQRKELTALIKTLRNRQGGGRLSRAQEHIAGYFPMLAETHDRISRRETSLQNLAGLLNRYIGPAKRALYDQTRYEFLIKSGDLDVPLSGLSSGEKQIVSLFATLMLTDDENLFVVIDEPELSLSVLWQELLLEDILSLRSCTQLLAVTHSPFIFGEKLARYTKDLSDSTSLVEIRRG